MNYVAVSLSQNFEDPICYKGGFGELFERLARYYLYSDILQRWLAMTLSETNFVLLVVLYSNGKYTSARKTKLTMVANRSHDILVAIQWSNIRLEFQRARVCMCALCYCVVFWLAAIAYRTV